MGQCQTCTPQPTRRQRSVVEFALALRHIWRHRIWLVPVVIVAIVAALAATYKTSLFPPSIESKSFEYGAASTKVLLDSPGSSLAEISSPISGVTERTILYASLLDTLPVRREIGRLAQVPWQQISVSGQTESQGASEKAGASQRASQLLAADQTASLYFAAEPEQPVISLYAQAPTAEQASRLVDAAPIALERYANTLENRRNVPPSKRIEFHQLGPAQAGMLASGADKVFGLLVALFVLFVGCLLVVLVPRFILEFRKADAYEHRSQSALAVPPLHTAQDGELENGSSPTLEAPQGQIDRG